MGTVPLQNCTGTVPSERPDADAYGKAAAPRRRELEVLAVVPVREVFDRERQPEPIAPAREVHAPADPLHGKAVERIQILGNQERRIEHVKVGRCVRFTRQAVEEYMRRNTFEVLTRAELMRRLAGV